MYLNCTIMKPCDVYFAKSSNDSHPEQRWSSVDNLSGLLYIMEIKMLNEDLGLFTQFTWVFRYAKHFFMTIAFNSVLI